MHTYMMYILALNPQISQQMWIKIQVTNSHPFLTFVGKSAILNPQTEQIMDSIHKSAMPTCGFNTDMYMYNM